MGLSRCPAALTNGSHFGVTLNPKFKTRSPKTNHKKKKRKLNPRILNALKKTCLILFLATLVSYGIRTMPL